MPFAWIELSSLLLSLPSTEHECKLVTPVTHQELIDAVCMFANPNQCRSLRYFQWLAGWINWALNMYPLLWPSLSNVYEKIQQGSSAFQKLSINNVIWDELFWLANHLEHLTSVHIIRPWEWGRTEAQDTYLCDACPSPRKNSFLDRFCVSKRVLPMGTQKVFLKEKSKKHVMCFSDVCYR